MSTPTLTSPASPPLPPKMETNATAPSDLERAITPEKQAVPTNEHEQHALATLGSARKHFLLLIFSIASFVDVCNVSGVAVAVAQIGNDTGLGISQLVWVSQTKHIAQAIPVTC
jgi:hypothetical protein